jgi:putative flippase GtrA
MVRRQRAKGSGFPHAVAMPWRRSDQTWAQLIRYGLVGIVSNGAGYLAYLLITHLGGTPKTTMSALYVIGATIGFFGNRNVTFSHSGSYLRSASRYVLIHTIGYFINLTILLVCVDKLGYPHQLVQAVSIFAVAAFLFTSFKLFVFSSTPGKR